MIKNWMAELATHYDKMQRTYPDEQLLIMFDIDGTILDMRNLVMTVLRQYDQHHNAAHFLALDIDKITVHENQIEPLLAQLNLPAHEHDHISRWFRRQAWSPSAILEAHRPFAGVLEVIRWFQLQPNTTIGLNTGRLESLRADTLRSLNQLGQEYKVNFSSKLLYMNPNTWDEPVSNSKVGGLRYFQQKGYRVIAFIDNEPANLEAIAAADPTHEILLLHADTIFESQRTRLPLRAVGGNHYDLTALISERALPRHIQFVWHQVSVPINLAQFLASQVHWGQLDSNLLLQADSTALLQRLRQRQKGLKLTLDPAQPQLLRLLKTLADNHYTDADLWFSCNVETMSNRHFQQIADAFPESIVQCPVDFLAPLVYSDPAEAHRILSMYQAWGINRFGVNWQVRGLRRFFDQMADWQFDIDIYDVRDLESFLRAVLLLPRSITATFNFPQWSYYGSRFSGATRTPANSQQVSAM